jgi:hypothetical protein
MKEQLHFANFLKRVMPILICAALLSLTACERGEPVDPYYFMQPQVPAVTPIKLDRAGAKYTMHFWVLPEPSSKIVTPFFIGIRSKASYELDAAALGAVKDFFRAADIPLEVKLTKLDEPTEKKIQLFSPPELVEGNLKYTPLKDDLAPVRQAADADNTLLIKNKLLDLKDHEKIDDRYHQFAEVRALPGYYRLEVKVLKENPNVPAVATDLIVSNYNKGK